MKDAQSLLRKTDTGMCRREWVNLLLNSEAAGLLDMQIYVNERADLLSGIVPPPPIHGALRLGTKDISKAMTNSFCGEEE